MYLAIVHYREFIDVRIDYICKTYEEFIGMWAPKNMNINDIANVDKTIHNLYKYVVDEKSIPEHLKNNKVGQVFNYSCPLLDILNKRMYYSKASVNVYKDIYTVRQNIACLRTLP